MNSSSHSALRRIFEKTKVYRLIAAKDYKQSLLFCTPLLVGCIFFIYSRLAVLETVCWAALGLTLWTFFEYVTHRFTFHVLFYVLDGKTALTFIHNSHHAEPREGVNAGLLSSLYMMSLCFLINLALTRHLITSLALLIGNALGYVAYEYMHYQEHFQESHKWYVRKMIAFHDVHHNKNIRFNFGITSPLWDMLLGTYKSSKSL